MKPGDTVELKHLDIEDDEWMNWSLSAKLELNTPYVIESVNGSRVRLKGKNLNHSVTKFKLVSTTNNTILFYC